MPEKNPVTIFQSLDFELAAKTKMQNRKRQSKTQLLKTSQSKIQIPKQREKPKLKSLVNVETEIQNLRCQNKNFVQDHKTKPNQN